MEATQHKAVTHSKHSAMKASAGTPEEDSVQANMDTSEPEALPKESQRKQSKY